MTPEAACRLARVLPEVTETTSSKGMPMFRVAGRRFAQLLPGEEELFVVARADERMAMLASEPTKFRPSSHTNGLLVVVAGVGEDEMGELLAEAWRACAPRRLARSLDPPHSMS